MTKLIILTFLGLLTVTLGYPDFTLEWKRDFAANYVPRLQVTNLFIGYVNILMNLFNMNVIKGVKLFASWRD